MKRGERNHPSSILQIWIQQIRGWIFPLLVFFFSSGRGEGGPTVGIRMLLAAISLLLLGGYSILRWSSRSFSIEDGDLQYRDGVLIRKTRKIPLSGIETVNLSRSPIQRLFGTTEVKVDTGHVGGNEAEVALVVSSARAEALQAFLTGERSADVREANEAHAMAVPGAFGEASTPVAGQSGSLQEAGSSRVLQTVPPIERHVVSAGGLLMAGLSSNAVFAGLLVLFSAWGMIDDVVEAFMPNFEDVVAKGAESALVLQAGIGSLLITILIVIGAYALLSTSAAAIGALIRWYGFTVERGADALHLRYGLLSLKQYHLPLKRIMVAHVKQTPFQQVLGTCSIHIESAGYGNEKGEANLLLPYARLKDAASLIARLIPALAADPVPTKPPKRALRRFLVQYLAFPLFAVLPLSIWVPYGFWSALVLPFAAVAAWLNWRNSGFSLNGQVLTMRDGGFWCKETRLRVSGIQAISAGSTGFSRRAGLFNLIVHIKGNTLGGTASVSYLEDVHREPLLDLMR